MGPDNKQLTLWVTPRPATFRRYLQQCSTTHIETVFRLLIRKTTRPFIHMLYAELLGLVFTFLDYEDWEHTALTCKYWNQVGRIKRPGYCRPLFLHDVFRHHGSDDFYANEWSPSCGYLSLLGYARSVCVSLNSFAEQETPWSILEQCSVTHLTHLELCAYDRLPISRLMKSIQSFHLVVFSLHLERPECLDKKGTSDLCEMLSVIPSLRDLCVETRPDDGEFWSSLHLFNQLTQITHLSLSSDYTSRYIARANLPSLGIPNCTHLCIQNLLLQGPLLTSNWPSLRSFRAMECTLDACFEDNTGVLQDIRLKSCRTEDSLRKRATHIESMYLPRNPDLDEYPNLRVLHASYWDKDCNRKCPVLETLSLYVKHWTPHRSLVSELQGLARLRVLQICENVVAVPNGQANFDSVCLWLPHLESLSMWRLDEVRDAAPLLSINISKASRLRHLRLLQLAYIVDDLDQIRSLPRLETLGLYWDQLRIVQKWITPLFHPWMVDVDLGMYKMIDVLEMGIFKQRF